MGKEVRSTIQMEVICSMDHWVCHLYAGPPRMLNGIYVIYTSSFFADVLNKGTLSPTKSFGDHSIDWAFFLVVGI